MKRSLLISLRLILIFTLLTGLVYPVMIWGIAEGLFKHKAEGSLIRKDGVIIGSELIGQQSDTAIYFWPRPSVTDYMAIPSGGSNLSWTDKKLAGLVKARKEAFLKGNILNDTVSIPIEMLGASGSGLDPHISPRAAILQVERIARARNFNKDQRLQLEEIIRRMTEKPQFSLFGEPKINVFLLNLELDKIK